MNENDNAAIQEVTAPDDVSAESEQQDAAQTDRQRKSDHKDARRWWVKLVIQPVLFLACGALLFAGLGVAQRLGWISGSGGGESHSSAGGADVRYICPMMCTPPQGEPGRCPVCAMELVPATSGGGNTDSNSIQIDPVARRVANIQTVAVKSMPMIRTIRAIGELNYDEGTLKSISAYVDGRLDRLYADYTGVFVNKGDHLALVYSPRLYSSQVELLLAKKAREQSRSSTLQRVVQSNRDLYENSKQRLIELGMTEAQIGQLEQDGKANSRLHLCAPISGTVIEKLAVEGQYVKESQAIYKLADLSTVWLMLELFPEDAAIIRYGQMVEAEVQSLPGKKFNGRVAFIDPNVNPKTRTVGVRVVIPNQDGALRVGDYAKAAIAVPVAGSGDQSGRIYDPELANKWISPRHPHVVQSSPGKCRICGVGLVPASRFGFTDQPGTGGKALVIPRDAVLMAGDNSVVYVETEPGRFEIRRVVLGSCCRDQIVILSGVKEGEQVATRGNFLIDSQMQLAGNPSLIDPTKAQPKAAEEMSPEVIAALAKLSEEDRQAAESQRICPVTKMALGSMGTPPKVDVNGQAVFICCKGCEKRLLDDPEKHLANLTSGGSQTDGEDPAIAVALAKLSPQDRVIARKQGICPVADMPLGSMGRPPKVDVNGTPVFICCEGCRESLLEEPAKYLAKLSANPPSQDSQRSLPQTNVPSIGVPQIIEPPTELPSFGVPQLLEPQGDPPPMEAPGAIIDRPTSDSGPTSTNIERSPPSTSDIRSSRRMVTRPMSNGALNQPHYKEAVR